MRRRGLVCSLLALVLLSSSAAFAVEYYRYTDEKGITVINRQGVPPHLIGQGYEVLSEQGRVVRVVPRAPTPEEYRAQKAEQAQAKADWQLLRLYPRVEDIDHACDRKVAELDAQINITRNNLLVVDALKADLQGQVALKKSEGRSVPAALRGSLAEATVDQQRLQRKIAGYLNSKSDLESAFAQDKTRLTELLKKR